MSSVKNKRYKQDILKLISSGYEVEIDETKGNYCDVKFEGPKESFYSGGTWKVHIYLPPEYPYKSPSIGFVNSIYHPNIDEKGGSVCLDVLNQSWSPMYSLAHIFDTFLPQLLMYPNPSDPLNGDAARLLMRSPEEYEKKVREHVKIYASTSRKEEKEEEKEEEEEKKNNKNKNENGHDGMMMEIVGECGCYDKKGWEMQDKGTQRCNASKEKEEMEEEGSELSDYDEEKDYDVTLPV